MYLADVQSIFYTVGIVFMLFVMVVFLVLTIVAITVAAKIRSMQKKIKNRMELITSLTRKGKGFMNGFRRGMNQNY